MIADSIRQRADAEVAPQSEEEARAFLVEFETAMAELVETIAEETALVRAGRLFAATDVVGRKNERLARYLRLRTRLKRDVAHIAKLMPDAVARMREDHMAAIETIRANLGVLAIAREVAEGIVRNVSASVGRQSAPRTYGRDAAVPAGHLAAARGISIDRRM